MAKTQLKHKVKTIYTSGKRGALAAIYICDYGNRIVANAEVDKVTFLQFKRCLQKEYPAFQLVQAFQRGCKDTLFIHGEA